MHPFATQSGCQLNNGVKHVFYLGFDNVHLRRDNSNDTAHNGDDNHNTDLNIPSDIEQVPALYNFLRGTDQAVNHPANNPAGTANYANGHNTTYTDGSSYPGGTILNDNHTPLIAHTSVDFTTTYTGVYGDRHGVAISQNNIAAYTGNAATPVSSTNGFSYWTDPLNIGSDTTQNLITPDGSGNPVNAPAPWVPFTRAGCDVGAVAATGFVLESATSVNSAFGSTSPEAVATSSTTKTTANQAIADYEGISVHCAQGSAICADASTDPSSKVVADSLPSEPGGYSGYQAVFGNKYVAPVVNDAISGTTGGSNTTLPLLRSGTSSDGFPGFNGEDGNYTLGESLDMQKAGIPITFGYLSDTHDCHSYNWSSSTGAGIKDSRSTMNFDYGGTYTDPTGTAPSNGSNPCDFSIVPGTNTPGYGAFGSGEAGYENYLSDLNSDFQSFFDQAKAAGYTTANSEFVFYSDENDHAAETTPANPTCDGVTVACQYNHAGAQTTPTAGQLGEVTVNVDAALPARSRQASQPYYSENDSAPDFYLSNSGSAAAPAQTDANVRQFEQDLGAATYTDPYTGNIQKLAPYEADQTELAALHMVTADPKRTPTVTVFAPGDVYAESGQNCTSTTVKNGATAVPVGGTSSSPETVTLAAATTTALPVGTTVTFGSATLQLTVAAPSGSTSLQGVVTGATIAANASGTAVPSSCSNEAYAYIHGDFAPETNNNWAGFAGPGIANNGVDTTTWTDHVDIRPTELALLGLKDDYTDDGRVITQIVTPGAIPAAGMTTTATDLGTMLKKLDAPVYQSSEGADDGFGTATLVADTTAVQGTNSGNYGDVENRIASITAQRNIVTSDIKARLTAASTAGTAIDASAAATDISEGQCLLNYANALKQYAVAPSAATAPTDCTIASGTNPTLPESPNVAIMALAGGVIMAGGIVVVGRRRRRYSAI